LKLSDRKKKILQLVVDDYISTAQPVSSKSITEKYMPDISSATVRSELSALEEMGYLTQLHTSSGRVPSAEAYKLYVTELMDKAKLTQKEIRMIRETFSSQADNLEEVVKNAVKVISDLTDYTSIALCSHCDKDTIVNIKIFRYKKDTALLLIVTEQTLIRDRFISIPESMTDEQIENANNLLNRIFVGKQFEEVVSVSRELEEEFLSYREIFESVIDAIEHYITDEDDVILEGQDKILNNPEYEDIEKVRNFLSVVASKDKLAGILSDGGEDVEISIKIGKEAGKDVPDDCSVVTATYSAGGVKMGTYGVIGPRRMDYQRVISVLESVGSILEAIINQK